MSKDKDPNPPFLCRMMGHKYPPVWLQSSYGGLWCYERTCDRCGRVHRISEVEFERKYAGR